MAGLAISIADGVHNSIFGKSQVPIKLYMEKRAEAFEQVSLLPNLFRMETSKNWAEKLSGDTALDDMEAVGEGGSYPVSDYQEGFSNDVEHMTWKNSIQVTQEMVEDAKLYHMKKKANGLITSGNRTREKFGRALYAGGLVGTTVKYAGKKFKCNAADGKPLFSKEHKFAKEKEKSTQSNLFSNPFSADILTKAETEMQNYKGDNGELVAVAPDTIWIPNNAELKDKVLSAIGADKDPETNNNGYNIHHGRWNVLIDPYLTMMLDVLKIKSVPWFLMDSQFIQNEDGAVWFDRKPMAVKSDIADNDNNVWKARARWSALFGNWRFICAGGMTDGTDLK